MSRLTLALLGVAILFVGVVAVVLVRQKESTDEINDGLAQACAAVNKVSPKMIDAVTRVDGASIAPNRTIRYHITILSNRHYTEKELGLLLPDLQKGYNRKESFKRYRVTCEYDYFNEDGTPIGSLSVSGN